jgi:hypothetical protein
VPSLTEHIDGVFNTEVSGTRLTTGFSFVEFVVSFASNKPGRPEDRARRMRQEMMTKQFQGVRFSISSVLKGEQSIAIHPTTPEGEREIMASNFAEAAIEAYINTSQTVIGDLKTEAIAEEGEDVFERYAAITNINAHAWIVRDFLESCVQSNPRFKEFSKQLSRTSQGNTIIPFILKVLQSMWQKLTKGIKQSDRAEMPSDASHSSSEED